jgi:hypothetical protein
MAALTARKNTPERTPEFVTGYLLTNTVAYQGGLAVIDTASGYTRPGLTATGLVAVGRFEETVSATGIASGVMKVRIRPGIYRFGNSADSDLIAIANRGAPCFIVDDNTVALTDGSSTRSVAGVIRDVDSVGVWVQVGSVNGTALASEITARGLLGTANLAIDALSPGVLKALTFAVADGVTANVDFVLAQKVRIVSAAFHKNTAAGGSGDTIRLANGATTNYICGAIANEVAANTVTAASTIVSTYSTIDAGGTLRIIRTKASAGNVGGWVELTVVGVA